MTGTGHDQTPGDPVANAEPMLTEFMRGKRLPASYREWKVCHHCGKREPAGQRFRQCAHCRTMRVEHTILYCSRDCQKGDWPDHKKICGNQEGSYDMKKDTGYIFVKPGSNKIGRLLLEWNHVYRRVLIWAARHAFASSPRSFENSCLIIEFIATDAREPDGTGGDRIFPVTYLLKDFENDEESPLIQDSTTIRLVVKDHEEGPPAPVAMCELRLYDEQMVVMVPMLPCDQDTHFAPYSNITAGPCPQWAFMLHLLSLHGLRSSIIVDSFLDGLLGCLIELENRADRPLQGFAAPTLRPQSWSIYEHGVESWLVLMNPYILRWKAKFLSDTDNMENEAAE